MAGSRACTSPRLAEIGRLWPGSAPLLPAFWAWGLVAKLDVYVLYAAAQFVVEGNAAARGLGGAPSSSSGGGLLLGRRSLFRRRASRGAFRDSTRNGRHFLFAFWRVVEGWWLCDGAPYVGNLDRGLL